MVNLPGGSRRATPHVDPAGRRNVESLKRLWERMQIIKHAVTFGLAIIVSSAVAVPAPAPAQAPLPAGRVGDVRALASAVYAALNAGATESEGAFTWSNDFFKGAPGTTDVPFTVAVDRTRLPDAEAALYLLATPHDAPETATDELPGRPSTLAPEELQGPAPPTVAFEAVWFVGVSEMRSDPATYRFSRVFPLSPGEYDVWVAIAPVSAAGATAADQAADPVAGIVPPSTFTPFTAPTPDSILVASRTLTVPDYWAEGFATSSVVVVDSVEPAGQAAAGGQQAPGPYTMGGARVVPAADTRFGPTERLTVAFFVYNPGLGTDGSPDVTVDYLVYRQEAEGARYHGRTRAQRFNAETLVGFDPAAGHQIVASQSVPLEAFPPGTYRLDIRVMDNTSDASVVRNVPFSIGEP